MIKRVRCSPAEANLHSLTIESKTVEPEHMRIKVSEMVFPSKTKQRHIVVLSLFSDVDLIRIANEINRYLETRE